MSNNLKVFKKGDLLFTEGEKAVRLYLIQSGLVSVFLHRPKRSVELFQVTGSQVLCEHAIFGTPMHPFSAVALNETKALEIPIEVIRAQIATSPQLIQLLLKSMAEKQKIGTNEIKSIRMEKDSSPCPPEHISKVFGVIYHVAKHVGMEKEDRTTVTWVSFKQYAQRVFLENPVRLENACNILVKLKMAEFEMVKNDSEPDAPPEYGYLHFFNLPVIEKFYEYFQHYYYKGGNVEFFKIDEKLVQLVGSLLAFTEKEKLNRAGVVEVSYQGTLEYLKTVFGPGFTPDQFERMEKKGLFTKRESSQTGGKLSFYRTDFESMLSNWKVLREIDKWNDKGVVELVEVSAEKPKGDKTVCPSCSTESVEVQKFCGNCGHKFEAKAA